MTRVKHKLKMWNKGGFNFWLVGLNYMRRRDAVMGRFLTRSEEKQERQRIIKLLESELGAGVDIEDTEVRDKVILNLIKLIKGEQK